MKQCHNFYWLITTTKFCNNSQTVLLHLYASINLPSYHDGLNWLPCQSTAGQSQCDLPHRQLGVVIVQTVENISYILKQCLKVYVPYYTG